LEIEAPALDQSGYVGSACPGVLTVTVFSKTLSFDTAPLCTLAQILGALVIVAASLASVRIIVGAF